MKNKDLYARWKALIYRCGNPKFPTYVDKSVCEEWKNFENFQTWSHSFVFDGMELDKDIILSGNVLYCPENCSYVPKWLNLVLVDSGASRGDYPLGVRYKKPTKGMVNSLKKPYEARCRDLEGKKLWLGYHLTPENAHRQWQQAKVVILEKALHRYLCECPNQDIRVIQGIEKRILVLKDDIDSRNETIKL